MPQYSRLRLNPNIILIVLSCLFFVLPSAKADEIITTESGAKVVADEFVVKYKDSATFNDKREHKEVMNLEKERVNKDSLKKMDIEQVQLKEEVQTKTIAEIIENLENDPAVQYVEPNYVMSIQSVNDPSYPEQWSLSKIGVEEIWLETMGSSGVVIAVLDTGIDYSHPDRPKNIVAGYDFINDDNSPQDDHGHGTFVSGVIAANTNNSTGIAGICQNCSIMPVKVMDSNGMGTYADVANGIVWSADNGADIINLSIGGYAYSQILQDAVSYAQSKGVLVIAAGGNQGISSPLYPAAYSNVIGVSATTQDDERWSDSNYGSYIDISAPGVSIYGLSLGGYRSQTGTSAAAPHIAGVAGLFMSKNQAISPNLIAQQLYQNTVDLGIEGKDYSFGYGRIGFGVGEEVVEEEVAENDNDGSDDIGAGDLQTPEEDGNDNAKNDHDEASEEEEQYNNLNIIDRNIILDDYFSNYFLEKESIEIILNRNNGILKNYEELISFSNEGGQEVYTAARSIAEASYQHKNTYAFFINSRVIIVLLELKWELISSGSANKITILSYLDQILSDPDFSQYNLTDRHSNFLGKILNLSKILNEFYEEFPSQRTLYFKNGSSLEASSKINKSTYAIQKILAKMADSQDEWERWLGNGEGSFNGIWEKLFGINIKQYELTLLTNEDTSIPPFISNRPFNDPVIQSEELVGTNGHEEGDPVSVTSFYSHYSTNGTNDRFDAESLNPFNTCTLGLNCYRNNGTYYHDGVDYATKYRNLYASHNGIISRVSNRYSTVTALEIEHCDNQYNASNTCSENHKSTPGTYYGTIYWHLDSDNNGEDWAVGDWVNAGDGIGDSDDGGSPGSPHLHFAVQKIVRTINGNGEIDTNISFIDPFGYWNDSGNVEEALLDSNTYVDNPSVNYENINADYQGIGFQSFNNYGSGYFWERETGAGAENNNALYTYPTLNPTRKWDNWAWWTGKLPNAGKYIVKVFIPSYTIDNKEVTSESRYYVYYQGGRTEVVINQAENTGQWVSLGEYTFEKGAKGAVRLTDEIHDNALCTDGTECFERDDEGNSISNTGKIIWADAVKWELAGPPKPDLEFVIDNDFKFEYEEVNRLIFSDYIRYNVNVKIQNIGDTTSSGGIICFSPKGSKNLKGCVYLDNIAPNETIPVSLKEFKEVFLYGNDPFGSLIIGNVIGEENRDNNYYDISLSDLVEAGGIDLTNAELGGIKIDPDSDQIKFVIKGIEAEAGDEVIDLGEAKSEQTKIFLQALAVPNDRHYISLDIIPNGSGGESGSARVPAPFEQTDIADAFLEADVVMKFDLFSADTIFDSYSYWTNLVQSSSYWNELRSKGFNRYPDWTMAATIVPGNINATQTGNDFFLEDIELDIDAGWWMREPTLDFSGLNLSSGAYNDLIQKLNIFKQTFEQAIKDRAYSITIPDLNDTGPDANPKFKRLRSIYAAISAAQWYKEQAKTNPSIPYAHIIDSEDLSDFGMDTEFDWNYWDAQAYQNMGATQCTLFSGSGTCSYRGGASLQESEPEITGDITGEQDNILDSTIDNFETVKSGNDTYVYGGTVTAVGPDLELNGVITESNKYVTSSPITFEVNVFNAGPKDASDIKLKVYDEVLSDAGQTTIHQIEERIISQIVSWDGVTESFNYTLPEITGIHSIYAVADPLNVIHEMSEGNNESRAVIQVFDPHPTITLISPTSGSVVHPEDIIFEATASDSITGDIENDSDFEWRSNIDGNLGTGRQLTINLSEDDHQITLEVMGSHGISGTKTFNLYVRPQGTPLPKIKYPIDSVHLSKELAYTFIGQAEDNEDGALTGSSLVWESDIDGILGSGTEITVQLSEGSHEITLTAIDSDTNETKAVIDIVIETGTPTLAISSPVEAEVTVEGTEVTFTGSATDLQEGDISSRIIWSSNIDGMLSQTASFSQLLSEGNHIITAMIVDSDGLQISEEINISIENTPPETVITSPVSQIQIDLEEEITLEGSATDLQDGIIPPESLTWSSDRDGYLGEGESVTIGNLSAGWHVITLTATDSKGMEGSTDIDLHVYVGIPTVNIIQPASGQEFKFGADVILEVGANDDQDGPLSGENLVWTSDLDGNLGTGTLLTLSNLSIGTHTIRVEATDNDNWKESAETSITINQLQAPQTSILFPTDGGKFEQGSDIYFYGIAIDPEDGALIDANITWSSNIDGQMGTGKNFSKSDLSLGDHTITLTAIDSDEMSTVNEIDITIIPTPPTLNIIEPADETVIKIGESIILSGNGTDNLTWTSNLDGHLGTDNEITVNLSLGIHQITLSGIDDNGMEGRANIKIIVVDETSILLDYFHDGETAKTYDFDGQLEYILHIALSKEAIVDSAQIGLHAQRELLQKLETLFIEALTTNTFASLDESISLEISAFAEEYGTEILIEETREQSENPSDVIDNTEPNLDNEITEIVEKEPVDALAGTAFVLEELENTNAGKSSNYNNSETLSIQTGNLISEFKITSSDAAEGDWFGQAVSIDGDYAVVGAYGDDDKGEASGSAYIFHRNGDGTWSQQTKLTADDGETGDYFGYRIASSISGDYAIVGAKYNDDNGNSSGSAYIFHRDGTTWSQQAKLIADDGADHDYFGASVSIDNDYAVVGAHGGGKAYIFHRDGTTWSQEAKLFAPGVWFGHSVGISGDYVVVGDHCYNTCTGAAYIFHRDGTTWSQQTKIVPSDGGPNEYFGAHSSIDGDYIIVGSSYHDGNEEASGSAYIYHRNGNSWYEQAQLTADDGTAYDHLGGFVDIDNNYAVLGAFADDINGDSSGSAYIFHRNDDIWSQQTKLLASDGAEDDDFGYSVSISGDYVIIGASGDDDNGSVSGSAYIYMFKLPPRITNIIVEEEIGADMDGLIDEIEHIKISWKTYDESGISDMRFLIDGETVTLIQDDDIYSATINPLSIGQHIYSIIATDNENTPQTTIEDGVFDVVRRPYVTNPSLDVTDNGILDWEYNGDMEEDQITDNFASIINDYLQVNESGVDGRVLIPIRVRADGGDVLKVSDINVLYRVLDTIAPVINDIILNPELPNAGDNINIEVSAMDNTAIDNVIATLGQEEVQLVLNDDVYTGQITAPGAGNYDFEVTVSDITELKTTQKIPIIVQFSGAELFTESVVFTPSSPLLAGQNTDVTITLRNTGSQSADAEVSITHTSVESHNVNIPAGSTAVINTSYTLPSIGDHIFTVEIDPQNLITESDEDNNTFTYNYQTSDSTPPVFEEINIPVYIGADQTFEISAKVTDNVNVESVKANWLGSEYVFELGVDDWYSVSLIAPSNLSTQQISLIANDSSGLTSVIQEDIEIIDSRPNPYINPTDIVVTSGNILALENPEFRINIHNNGGSNTDTPVIIKLNGNEVYSETILVESGSFTTINWNEWTAMGGTHELIVTLDPQNIITEINEGDNTAVYNLTVPYTLPPILSNLIVTEDVLENQQFEIAVDVLGDQEIKSVNININGGNYAMTSSDGIKYSYTGILPIGSYPFQITAINISDLAARMPGNLVVNRNLADLVVDIPQINPVNLTNNDTAEFGITVRNNGFVTAIDVPIEIKLDGEILSTETVTLTPKSEIILPVISWDAVSGSHVLEVEIDTGNLINEIDETNNLSSISFNVGNVNPPDIIEVIAKEILYTNETFIVEATIEDEVDITVTALINGNSYSMTYEDITGKYLVNITAPSSIDDYSLVITAHNIDGLTSSWERSVTVLSSTPDLAINPSDITIAPSGFIEDETVTVTALVHNYGGTDLGSVTVVFKINGTAIDSNNISVTKGGSTLATFGWTPDFGMQDIEIVIDPNNNISESNESNNSYTASLFADDIIAPTTPILVADATILNAIWSDSPNWRISWPDVEENNLKGYSYQIDGGIWNFIGFIKEIEVSFDTPGEHMVCVMAEDLANNVSQTACTSVLLDFEAPEVPVLMGGTNDHWSPDPLQSVMWTSPLDDGSGPDRYLIKINGDNTELGNQNYYKQNWEDGQYSAQVCAIDKMEHQSEWSNEVELLIDSTSPEDIQSITSSTHPESINWYTDTNPDFDWNIPNDLSGVQGFYYYIDQKSDTSMDSRYRWIENNQLTVPEDESLGTGSWNLHVTPVDQAGNTANQTSHYQFQIDLNAPSTTVMQITNNIVLLDAHDPHSGIKHVYYSIRKSGGLQTLADYEYDDFEWSIGDSITFNELGNYQIFFYSEDNIGNREDIRYEDVNITSMRAANYIGGGYNPIETAYYEHLDGNGMPNEENGLEKLESLYNYYKVRKEIACRNGDFNDARCFWARVELIHAKELLGKDDIDDQITFEDIKRIIFKIVFFQKRVETYCENKDKLEAYCPALKKLIQKGEYFMSKE